MRDVILDLCTNLRDHESALLSLRAAGKSGRPEEVARMMRNVELCERWLHVAGGGEALARMRAGGDPRVLSRYGS